MKVGQMDLILWNKVQISFLLLLSFFILTGCARISLSPRSSFPSTSTYSPSNPGEEFCISKPVTIVPIVKIMFVIDTSGSNNTTDPNGLKRVNGISGLMEGLSRQEHTDYEYGVIIFEGRARSLINNMDSQPEFTDDLARVSTVIEEIKRNPAGGGTRYLPALEETKRVIDLDIQTDLREDIRYMILFISDGQPMHESIDKILSKTSSVVEESDREVNLSTALYGSHSSSGPEELLIDMADRGNGHSVNFENDETWDLNLMLPVPNVIPWNLKQFFVYNLNAGFCMDGVVGVDSDVDGMCDRDEEFMNGLYADQLQAEGKSFDPANRFSFGDGYGDYFHWLRFKYPGKTLPACEDRSDEDHDLLTLCEEKEIRNELDTGEVRSANPKIFDTDKDGILDGIETYIHFYRSEGHFSIYTAALDSRNAETFLDGEDENFLEQIKQHRNPWYPDEEALSYDTTLTSLLSRSEGNCYILKQTVLPVYKTLEVKEGNTLAGWEHAANENVVMTYYIQVPWLNPQSVGILKYRINKFQWMQGLLDSEITFGMDELEEYVPASEQTF